MRHLGKVGLAVVGILVAASQASAQRAVRTNSAQQVSQGGFWEIGADAGAVIGLDDPRTFSIAFPIALVRGGYFVSDVISLEPALRFSSFSGQGFTGFSSYRLDLSMLYHLSTDRTRPQTFIRPTISILGSSGGGNTRTGLGVGVGMKRPAFTNRAAWRMEANILNYMKSGTSPSALFVNALFGISLYTK